MTDGRASTRTAGWAWAAALASLLATPANAETSVIAVSRSQHARVLAQGSPSWCSLTLHLTLELEAGSPDRGDPTAQARLLSRLRRLIETDCPTARQALASVSGEASATFVARADGGWNFTIPQGSPGPAPVVPEQKDLAAADLGDKAATVTSLHNAFPTPVETRHSETPQPFPAPQPAPSVPSPTQRASDVPGTKAGNDVSASAPVTFTLPRELNYPSFVVALARTSPGAMNDPETVRYWATHRFPRQFQRVANEEFELQPLLDQARHDLEETIAATPPGRVLVTLSTQFGTYDFPHHRFPISLPGDRLSVSMDPCCQAGDALPRSFQLDLDGLNAIDGLPMGEAEAQQFAKSRTRYGNVDRSIVLLLTVQLNDAGIGAQQYGQSSSTGTVKVVDVLAGRNLETIVHRFSATEVAELRMASAKAKADAERLARERQAAEQKEADRQRAEQRAQQARMQAEQERQQLLSQRQGLTASLARQPLSARLRAFMTPGPYADGRHLDNLREARADAVITRQAWDVVMLVQANGNGRAAVPTSWPGYLAVTVPAGASALAGSQWYLVAGKLAVPSGEDVPPAQLLATEVFACAQATCRDAAEPDAIVERKIHALGEQTQSP